MQIRKVLVSALLATSAMSFAANTSQTVSQVTGTVTLSADVDYHITSETPFATTGSIDITNTDHAVIIFDKVKPSAAEVWLTNISINGEKAVLNKNCQLRVYNGGAMLLPYNADAPLTVYTETNYGGTSVNSYVVNTIYNLSNNKNINNNISSFKLKRGYMVCFATQGNGQGYSRVFIADQADKELDLPKILNNKVSFIRVSKWNNVHKRGWAGWWNDATQEMLNTSWCYNWDANSHDWKDREYVTQHHHEGWPGIADVGNNTGGANILGNNEPENKADDKEQDVDVKNVLANWPQMMATGRRLGSPAVAGDYNWLYEFIDSIDAKGWRCDFIAVHAYWYKDQPGWKSQLEGISNRCGGRPIWITEMNYGANWTGWPAGSDTSGSDANYAIEKQHMGPILDYLNDAPYIERYAFYNNVQDCRYAIAGGKLTPIGEYYANLPEKLAYNDKYEYIPKTPKMYAPTDVTSAFIPSSARCTISWANPSGEFMDSMFVERKNGANGVWERCATVTVEDNTSKTYSYGETVTEAGDYTYRIHTIDFNGKNYYSKEVLNTVAGTEGTEDIQWGKITIANTDNNYSYYKHEFTENPAVVFGSPTAKNLNTKAVEQVYSVTKKYAILKYFPWSASSSDTQTFTSGGESSSYLVGKSGNGMIGSLNYEMGYLKDASGATLKVDGDTVEYKFDKAFDEVPVVFVTAQSTNKAYPYIARVWDVTKEGFKVVMTRQKGTETSYPKILSQKVSYFAIDKGTTTAFGKVFTVKDTVLTYKYAAVPNRIEFGKSLIDPMLYAQFQTFDRKTTSMLRFIKIENTQGQVRLTLDTSDTDRVSSSNPFVETVGWMTISTADETTGVHTPVAAKESSSLDVQVTNGEVCVRDVNASSVTIYTVAGANVATAKVVGGEARFDLSALPTGVLVVKANSGKAAKVAIRR